MMRKGSPQAYGEGRQRSGTICDIHEALIWCVPEEIGNMIKIDERKRMRPEDAHIKRTDKVLIMYEIFAHNLQLAIVMTQQCF